MSRIVMKFGGTSVADIDRIVHAAQHVLRELESGNQVAVVVSAMAGTTNQLIEWTNLAETKTSEMQLNAGRKIVHHINNNDEKDAVVSSGEQVTAALMAITLRCSGADSRSWTGWQIPVHTDDNHGSAKINDYQAQKIIDSMSNGGCPVVTGFQGVTQSGRIATLGRGGSDLSAVALAVAVNADRCDIYTDVDGVYTADPRHLPTARRIDRVSFETMLELASAGSKVIQTRAVRLARAKSMPLVVRSTFEDPADDIDFSIDSKTNNNQSQKGTLICHKEELMERLAVNAITCDNNQAQITLRQVNDQPGVAAAIFGPLGEADVFVDMIAQSISADNTTDMSFTVAASDLDKALKILQDRQKKIGFETILHATNVAKITVVGDGMLIYAGVVGKMFSCLADAGINLLLITTSEIRISVLVQEDHTQDAVEKLHSAFELDYSA